VQKTTFITGYWNRFKCASITDDSSVHQLLTIQVCINYWRFKCASMTDLMLIQKENVILNQSEIRYRVRKIHTSRWEVLYAGRVDILKSLVFTVPCNKQDE